MISKNGPAVSGFRKRWGRFLFYLLQQVFLSSSVMARMTWQGLPTATELSGMSFTTTLPPPMTTLLPMVTPGITCTPAPIQTLSPTVIG